MQYAKAMQHGLIYQEVLLPPMAPPEWKDREQLWNAVEAAEKTKDSRLAREFVVALPIELDKDSNISLLQNFIQKNFVDMGMCADFAIHDTDGHNPHAHILLTVRPLNENGTWQYKTEKEYLCIKNWEKKDLQLLNPNAVLARDFSLEPIIYDIWWCFSPPNSESGGTFCPHSGNVAKILFRFIIHTKWKLSISPLR